MAAREVACFERGVLFVLGYYFVIYIFFSLREPPFLSLSDRGTQSSYSLFFALTVFNLSTKLLLIRTH